MYQQQRISVVIPVHNEADFIIPTILALPDYVDDIIVVDDGSTDASLARITQLGWAKLRLIRHEVNQGVGAATISGYQEAQRLGTDIAVVMDGDGQMHPTDLPTLLHPIINQSAEYVKGNRFLDASISAMPWARYLGNRILSWLTQQAAGLQSPIDAQCGYTAIKVRALQELPLKHFYPRYGFLNEFLLALVVAEIKIATVPVKTIYGKEVSDLNPFKAVPVILALIGRGYWQRWQHQRRLELNKLIVSRSD
jgi:glycosyltransferase involved in cell wall biosynthesis